MAHGRLDREELEAARSLAAAGGTDAAASRTKALSETHRNQSSIGGS